MAWSADDIHDPTSSRANMMLMQTRGQESANFMGSGRDRSPLIAAAHGIFDHGSILQHRPLTTPFPLLTGSAAGGGEDSYGKAQSMRASSLFLPFLDAVALMGGSRGGGELTEREEMTYDSQGMINDEERRKKKRLRADQVRALEDSFGEGSKLEAARKVELAQALGLQPRQVAVWFQNRRARSKTKHLERDFALLQSQYHGLVAETRKLRAEVSRLSEELAEATKGSLQSAPTTTSLCEGAMPIISSMSTNTGSDHGIEENEAYGVHIDHEKLVTNGLLNQQQGSIPPTSPSFCSGIVVDGVNSPPHSQGNQDLDRSLAVESSFHNIENYIHVRDQPLILDNMLQYGHHFHLIPYNSSDCSYHSMDQVALDSLW